MIPNMWASISPEGRPDIFRNENAIQYIVTGFPGNDGVYIQVETTAQHKNEWHIIRNNVKSGKVYDTAQAALQALGTGTE